MRKNLEGAQGGWKDSLEIDWRMMYRGDWWRRGGYFCSNIVDLKYVMFMISIFSKNLE